MYVAWKQFPIVCRCSFEKNNALATLKQFKISCLLYVMTSLTVAKFKVAVKSRYMYICLH